MRIRHFPLDCHEKEDFVTVEGLERRVWRVAEQREHARRAQRCDRASHLSAVTEVAENPGGWVCVGPRAEVEALGGGLA